MVRPGRTASQARPIIPAGVSQAGQPPCRGLENGDLLLGGVEPAALLVDDRLRRLGDEGRVRELGAQAAGLLAELVERLVQPVALGCDLPELAGREELSAEQRTALREDLEAAART